MQEKPEDNRKYSKTMELFRAGRWKTENLFGVTLVTDCSTIVMFMIIIKFNMQLMY